MDKLIEKHMDQIRERYPEATIQESDMGTHLVTVPGVPLSEGWNATETTVQFVIPYGYPAACPVDFYTSATLRLDSGLIPNNADGPHKDKGVRFFHRLGPNPRDPYDNRRANWDPIRDTLLVYLNTIRVRFATRGEGRKVTHLPSVPIKKKRAVGE